MRPHRSVPAYERSSRSETYCDFHSARRAKLSWDDNVLLEGRGALCRFPLKHNVICGCMGRTGNQSFLEVCTGHFIKGFRLLFLAILFVIVSSRYDVNFL
jgi:hypothetical protein